MSELISNFDEYSPVKKRDIRKNFKEAAQRARINELTQRNEDLALENERLRYRNIDLKNELKAIKSNQHRKANPAAKILF